ncbi:MAG: helix-turn-helix transcriptional regulator [Phycisphaerae bacterium]|nr:helix-turn-helix transcriptional regulator [Phycisphaerae bacterium]
MDDAQFTRIARTLADPRRFEILERIAAAPEVACMDVKHGLPITESTLSHHVGSLVEAGLIRARKAGKCGYFALERGVLDAYRAELARRLSPGGAAASTPARKGPAKTRGRGGRDPGVGKRVGASKARRGRARES